jgi:hypothetical protein
MAAKKLGIAIVSISIAVGAGCKKNPIDTMEFKSALNSYYASHQRCVWDAPVKFPAQADTKNDEQTRGFDALTDAGLLTRKPEEKKRFLIGSKPVNDYDLSDQGRSSWTADASQPGYGNFCYGHEEATSIDTFTPPDNPDATQVSVNYHMEVKQLPNWADNSEVRAAFPKIASDASGSETATANLNKNGNSWQVASVQGETPAMSTGQ